MCSQFRTRRVLFCAAVSAAFPLVTHAGDPGAWTYGVQTSCTMKARR